MKTLYIHIFIIAALLTISMKMFAQDDASYKSPDLTPVKDPDGPSGFDPSRLFTGGGMGLSFGDITYVELSPQLGYMFTDKLAAGVTVEYTYLNNSRINQSFSMYGGSVFGRFFVLENIYAQLEFEALNLDYFDPVSQQTTRANTFATLVGGGYGYPLGGRSFLNVSILFNVTKDRFYPRQDPIVRGGIGIGL